MSTTVQDVIARARGFSVSNAPLTADSVAMLARIRSDQASLYARAAEKNRDFFSVTVAANSTPAAANRTVDLSGITPPLERLLLVKLVATGDVLNQVDLLDDTGELPPRYTVQGALLSEVGSDWGATGIVPLSLTYVQAPLDIDPAGALSQPISLPDPWTDVLAIRLAQFLHQTDAGRDPLEGERLASWADERQADFLNHVAHYGGVRAQRFMVPSGNAS